MSWLDVKLGVRMLVRYPGLSLAGAFAIAVVVACGTAAAAFDAVVNGSLPFEDGDRIVAIENWDTRTNEPRPRALHDLTAWRGLETVEEVGAYQLLKRNLAAAEPVRIAQISASAFRIARVPPLLGRFLLDADEHDAAPPVLLIGYDEWQRRFGGDPRIIGSSVLVGDTPHTVVGIMPDGFGFPENENYWAPLRLDPADYPRGGGPVLNVFGRLVPDADLAAAQAELTVVGQRAAVDHPDTHAALRPRVLPYTHWFFAEMHQGETIGAHLATLLLLGIVGANVAVLVHARTATRRNEIAVRTALGASRSRIVAQMFAEGLVLSAVASAVGLLLATIVRQQLQALIVQAPFWVDTTLTSGPVIRNVLGLAVLGAVVVGVIPALQATGRRAQTGLQHAAARASRWKIGRMYGALIIVQVALAVALLPVAIATAWQSVQSATAHPGFAADEFLVARLDMERETASDADRVNLDAAFAARFRDRQAALVPRLRGEPDVADISFLLGVPDNERNALLEIEGREGVYQTGTGRIGADLDQIDVDVLEPFDIQLLAGRAFDSHDIDKESAPVIVNRTFARRLIAGDAVGRRIRERRDSKAPGPWLEIVGVISDFPAPATPATADPMMYFPAGRGEAELVLLAIRVRGGTPARFTNRLREIVGGVDRNLQLSSIVPMDELLWRLQTELRLVASVSGLITLSVLLLSATGLYALMAFTVTQRRAEIGLRLALGATPFRLLTMIMSRSLAQLAIGITIGSTSAWMMLAEGEITGENGMAMLPAVAAIVLLVGLLAAATPARRALRVQPTEALRDE
ncbi:MAG: ABC transporter permease [Vicinamibacteraceae bacterium]